MVKFHGCAATVKPECLNFLISPTGGLRAKKMSTEHARNNLPSPVVIARNESWSDVAILRFNKPRFRTGWNPYHKPESRVVKTGNVINFPQQPIQPPVLVYSEGSVPNDSNVIEFNQPRISPIAEPHEAKRIEVVRNLRINRKLGEGKWDMRSENARLVRDINRQVDSGASFEQAVEASVKTLEHNIRAFNFEIIRQEPVLPHLNTLGVEDGRIRMLGSNGEPVVDAVSSEERNGAVLDASVAIEDFLAGAPNNSYAVLMNPAGWNGYKDKNGTDAEPHLNAQVMVFWKDNSGGLKGLTIVVDLEQYQVRDTMVSLGVDRRLLGGKTEAEEIANIVANPALLSFPRSDITPFEHVLDKILAIRGSRPFSLKQRKGKPVIRSVEYVRENIRNFEDLLRASNEEERLIAEAPNFVIEHQNELGEENIQQRIIDLTEQTILFLTSRQIRSIKGDTTPVEIRYMQTEEYQLRKETAFSKEIEHLQNAAGCPVSASEASSILRGVSFSSRGTISIESDSMGSLSFPCPVCGFINKRPREGFVEVCQNSSCSDPTKLACHTKASKNKDNDELPKAA